MQKIEIVVVSEASQRPANVAVAYTSTPIDEHTSRKATLKDRGWDYFDASRDPHAQERCHIPKQTTETLTAAGFERVGCALAIYRLNGAELVHEIWGSADGFVLAEVIARTGRIELVTLLEDGLILKTAMRPPWFEWILVAPGMRAHRLDRYVYQAVGGSFATVHARHLERVSASGQRTVAGLEPMLTHFATRLRIAELRDTRVPRQFALSWWVGVPLGMLLAFAIVGRHHFNHRLPPLSVIVMLDAMMLAPCALVATVIARVFITPEIVRMRPGPPALPATELVERASNVPQGRVYRY